VWLTRQRGPQDTGHHFCGSSVLEAHPQSTTTALKLSYFGRFSGSQFISANEWHLNRKGSLPPEGSPRTPVTQVGLDAPGRLFSGDYVPVPEIADETVASTQLIF
jgi:hypothetical protein